MNESETSSQCEQSFVTTVDAGAALLVSHTESVVAFDTGATANSARFSCLVQQNSILAKHGFPKVTTYPSKARFRFGDERLGEVRRAGDIPCGRYFTAFVSDGDIPALLREGAVEALGGQLDFLRGLEAYVHGLQGGYPRGRAGQQSGGSQEDCDEVARELGSRASSTAQEGIGGFGGMQYAFTRQRGWGFGAS